MYQVPVFKKTRIAPTPSGYLHLGNLLSFVITAGLARKHQASILLRIDDLDQARARKEYVDDIFETLEFMGIPWDEGPRNYEEYIRSWSQVHRLPRYKEALQYLHTTQQVFACNCSRSTVNFDNTGGTYPGACLGKNLPLESSSHNWRLNTDDAMPLSVSVYPASASSHTLPATMQHFVVRKKDGSPAYQLSSVIDDSYFDVDLVVRGMDLWHSTLAQVYLGSLLPGNIFPATRFVHHRLLPGPDGQKLSKSAGAASIRYLRSTGMTASEIYSLLGQALGCQEKIGNWPDLFHFYFWRQ